MARIARIDRALRRRRTREVHPRSASEPGARARCFPPDSLRFRRIETRYLWSRSLRSPAIWRWRSASPRSFAGTRLRWSCGRTRLTGNSGVILRPMPPPQKFSRSASIISFAAATAAVEGKGDLVFFQPHSAPGVYARAFLEGTPPSEQRLEHFPTGDFGRRPQLLPSSVADAGLLAVSYRFHGHRPNQAQSIRRAFSAISKTGASKSTQGRHVWGVFGDGEMDEPESIAGLSLGRPRTAGQFDLHQLQLQSAAARWSRSRKRADHPGA